MRKPILPIAAVLAVAPTLANAQDPNVISFDVSALKSSLYSVINTIGHQGQNDGYAQPVKDIYLVKTSALENEIDAYYQKIVKGEVTSQDAADAKYKEFTASIEQIRKDAAAAQAPYQKALDDAVAAVKADQEAYTAAQKAVEALSVPSVKATWEAELAKITLPTAPNRTDNIDANKKIASDVAAGHTPAMNKQIALTIEISKLHALQHDTEKALTIGEGLYLATKGPGRFYGRTGSFETGYAFDALVIHMDDMEGLERTPFEKLQQFIYDGDDRNIIARYVDGELVVRG